MKKYLITSLRAFVMVMLLISSTVLPVTIAPDLALAATSSPDSSLKSRTFDFFDDGVDDAVTIDGIVVTLNTDGVERFHSTSTRDVIGYKSGGKYTFNFSQPISSFTADLSYLANFENVTNFSIPPSSVTGDLVTTGSPIASVTTSNKGDSGKGSIIWTGLNTSEISLTLNPNAPGAIAFDSFEFKVAEATAQAATPTNLALNKTTSQSSNAYGSNNGIKAVDGKTNGDYWDDSVTHTANNPQEWWQVDLGDVYDIDTIRVYNRTDCCSERLSNFAVMVASEPFPTQKDLSKALPQSTWSQKFSGTAGVKEEFRVKSSGRYVRIQLAGTNYLSLAEVEVFGTPAQTPVVTPTEPETGEVTNPTPTCDAPYVLNPGNNHCYGKTNELTWSDAQAVAKAAGGNLVTINDRAEQDWLEKTFGTLVWIGLYVPGQNDASEFEWVSNGQAPSYTRWGVDQPQKHGEYFVLLTKDSTWHDYSQSAQFPGIIEIEPGSQTSSVNIDPTQNYDSSTAVTRNLPAGEYKVEVIGTAQGGQFDAWSRKCNCKWDTYYSRRLGSSGPKKIGNPNKYNSKAEALANRVPSTSFTLTDETDVKFYTYSTSAADNIGGVSMQVEGNGIKQSVDLDATQNVNKEHAEICSLPAGDYTVTLLGTAEGGKYDAWSSTCSKKWRHAYKIRGDAKVTVAETGVYDNAGEAFAHRPAAETFRLKAPGEVKFYTYSASPENDCGGVSLNVTRIGS